MCMYGPWKEKVLVDNPIVPTDKESLQCHVACHKRRLAVQACVESA